MLISAGRWPAVEKKADVEQQGLDVLTPYTMGTLAMPRLHELLATVNRMRKLIRKGQ